MQQTQSTWCHRGEERGEHAWDKGRVITGTLCHRRRGLATLKGRERRNGSHWEQQSQGMRQERAVGAGGVGKVRCKGGAIGSRKLPEGSAQGDEPSHR